MSTTLKEEDLVDNWGETTILRSFEDVAALKETDGGPISIHGSASLARGLADAGLLDRYHLLVFPWVLGAGKRMWSETDKDRQKLELVESEAYAQRGSEALLLRRALSEAQRCRCRDQPIQRGFRGGDVEQERAVLADRCHHGAQSLAVLLRQLRTAEVTSRQQPGEHGEVASVLDRCRDPRRC